MSHLTPDQPPLERRRDGRGRVLWGGMIASADGVITAECVILNMNERGALIRSSHSFDVGAKVYLVDSRIHHAHVANVLRSHGDEEFALKFNQSTSISAAQPPVRDILMPLFLRAKLMQIRILWNHGFSPEEILEHTHADRTLLDAAEGRADVGIEFGFVLTKLRSIMKQRHAAPSLNRT